MRVSADSGSAVAPARYPESCRSGLGSCQLARVGYGNCRGRAPQDCTDDVWAGVLLHHATIASRLACGASALPR